MRCTLVDTGPLVALLDERDGLHGRAARELDLAPRPRLLCAPVVVETLHLLGAGGYPARLRAILDEGVMRLEAGPPWPVAALRCFEWMDRYADHEPDLADAFLVAWYEAESGARIWSFDPEFKTVWRTSKGRSLRLVGAK
jgi:predicted nucleic acid-binding protein